MYVRSVDMARELPPRMLRAKANGVLGTKQEAEAASSIKMEAMNVFMVGIDAF